MSLRVSGKNINIGEALRTHVVERVNALTSKYFDGGVSGHVTITPEGAGYRTDCSLHLTSGMLLQADGQKLRLLPAWPRHWDVHFKLHAPGRTTVECLYRAGRVVKLDVRPASRQRDLVMPGDAGQ